MKLFPFLKSMSRTVHEEHRQDSDTEASSSACTCTCLTVWRRSLVMSCNGFTVIDSSGNLVYTVDNYMGLSEPLVLMDSAGKALLTMSRRKKLRLVLSEWLVYEEEGNKSCARTKWSSNDKKPIMCVTKSIMNNMNMLLQSRNGGKILAYVFLGEGRYDYVIQGSYADRSCKVSDRNGRVMVEIRRKEATGVCFGTDVFLLIVYPSFRPVLAMALVLILDRMF